jgi:hypothetical protein
VLASAAIFLNFDRLPSFVAANENCPIKVKIRNESDTDFLK